MTFATISLKEIFICELIFLLTILVRIFDVFQCGLLKTIIVIMKVMSSKIILNPDGYYALYYLQRYFTHSCTKIMFNNHPREI